MSGRGDHSIRRWIGHYARGLPARDSAERHAGVEADAWEQGPAGPPPRIPARTAPAVASELSWGTDRSRLARTGTAVSARRPAPVRRAAPRVPGLTYAGVALVLVILVATSTLTSRRPSPPTIAEFAPQAVEQIAESSDGADGQGRTGSSEGATNEEGPAEGAAQVGIDVARVRSCVGDPPRQIEDPQAPPCVPYWSGDNGGATAHGVTRDEIIVASANEIPQFSAAMQAFFNRRFEFYGRRIRIVTRTLPQDRGAGDRAAARTMYEQDKAFAFIGSDGGRGTYDFYDELARLGVVGVDMFPVLSESVLAARRPYLWSYVMTNDRIFATVGNWYCARFAGRNAVHAGEPLLQGSTRKLGVIINNVMQGTTVQPLLEQAAACGQRDVRVLQTTVPGASDPAFNQNAVLQMKTAGVTTIVNLVDGFGYIFTLRAATNQAYFPEWLVTPYIRLDMNAYALLGPAEQTAQLMALSMNPMERWPSDSPAEWAALEATGTGCPVRGATAFAGGQFSCNFVYRPFLLLASGIQLAGPRLTPAAFEAGLQRARFPNPPHRIMAGAVGFTNGDHSMTDDAAEMWFSNEARRPSRDPDRSGALCYVDHGARRRLGGFPSGDGSFFAGACDSGV